MMTTTSACWCCVVYIRFGFLTTGAHKTALPPTSPSLIHYLPVAGTTAVALSFAVSLTPSFSLLSLQLRCDHPYGRICKSTEGYAATNSDGKIVGVTFVDTNAKGSKVAILGPVAALSPGTGKKTFMAACAHAEKLGFSTLVSEDVFGVLWI